MNEKLAHDLYLFADNGQDRKDEVFKNVIQKIDTPVKFKLKRLIPAAISLCLIIALICNFNIIARSISNIIGTIMMNEIEYNNLQELLDLSLYTAQISGTAIVLDENSIEYQIVYGTLESVEKPCYIYMFYYRGYLKWLIFDEDTKNIDEIEEWLRTNGGIVARAASVPEEAAVILSNSGSVRITPAKIREIMGNDCVLPSYLPNSKKSGNIIQYSENIGTINITYFFEGKADFDPNGAIENYIALGITKTDTEYSKNLTANLTVTEDIEINQINGYDVYIADGYYVWEQNSLIYVLYTTFAPHEEVIKIIENMK